MWNFLAGGANLTMWVQNIDDPPNLPFADRPAFVALVAIHDALKPTPLFRPGSWLLVCIAVCALAWRRRDTPAGTFAIGACGSAAVYTLTFFAVGVASDFRYGYWAVLAGLTGAIAIAQSRDETPSC
jgi:peptidoglycan/LPS O-acetylase OafA/YrhL